MEYIEIQFCPRCEGKHRYKLEVTRSFVLRMMLDIGTNEPKRQVKITRIFTCPVKQEDFEATFFLQDTSSDRIKGVHVEGIVNDNDEQ